LNGRLTDQIDTPELLAEPSASKQLQGKPEIRNEQKPVGR